MPAQPLVILGLDPGYADTGWGVIRFDGKAHYESCGSISTAKDLEFGGRLVLIAKELEDIITKYQPQRVAMEKLFFNSNTTTAMKVAEARGVVRLILARHNLPLVELTPTQVKQGLTGNGQATKQQIGKMVCLLLQLSSLPRPDDAVDALACALCATGKVLGVNSQL